MLHQPFFIPAVLILLIAIPLILGLIPRNWGYGIRTTKTLSDDRIWYRANRYGGWAFLLSSIFYLIVAVVVPNSTSGSDDIRVWFLHLCAFLSPLLLSILLIRRYIENS